MASEHLYQKGDMTCEDNDTATFLDTAILFLVKTFV